MDNITYHFQRQAGKDLKNIFIIFLFLLISGCGTVKPAILLSDPLIPKQDSGLASTRIPAPPDIQVVDFPTNSELQALNQPEAVPETSPETDQDRPRDDDRLFALTLDEEKFKGEPVSPPLADKMDPEPDKNFAVERKAPSALAKIAKVPKPRRPDLFSVEESEKRGEGKPLSETSMDANPAEVHSSTPNERIDADRWANDLFGQMDGKSFLADSSPEGDKPSSLSSAVSIFPSLVNEKVNSFISFFQRRADAFFSRSLARSQAYEEMMKKIFREKNLPEELFYLALIESGYNPTALSRAKASGIWQFLGQTAKRFGLRVDKWVDERRDPEKSTQAAAEYLKTLHGMFNSWDLAAAGYNAGEGKVLKAMKIARSDDFWEISRHRYLKQETKAYVPMFLAAVTIAKDPQKYGFDNIEYHPPLVYEKVTVPPSTTLALIAKAAETNLSEIRSLNPALIREKTPPNSPSFDIKLPMGKKDVFEKNFPTMNRISAKMDHHRVGSGESLARVAKKYHVRLKDLCAANEISPQTKLKPGSILKIPQ